MECRTVVLGEKDLSRLRLLYGIVRNGEKLKSDDIAFILDIESMLKNALEKIEYIREKHIERVLN